MIGPEITGTGGLICGEEGLKGNIPVFLNPDVIVCLVIDDAKDLFVNKGNHKT